MPGSVQRGHHEAWIGPLGRMLGLADHAAAAAPAVARRPGEVLEAARRLSAGRALGRCLGQLAGDLGLQAHVPRQAEQVVDAVGLAPRHQRLAGEAGIGSQHDPDLRPAASDLMHDPLNLLEGPGRSVDVGRPQLGRKKVTTAEDVQRQVAVAAVVTVEEPALLLAVHRIVGGVQVEDDLGGRRRMRLHEQIDEQPLDRRPVVADLVVARRLRPTQLQTVQCALARQRRTLDRRAESLPTTAASTGSCRSWSWSTRSS